MGGWVDGWVGGGGLVCGGVGEGAPPQSQGASDDDGVWPLVPVWPPALHVARHACHAGFPVLVLLERLPACAARHTQRAAVDVIILCFLP